MPPKWLYTTFDHSSFIAPYLFINYNHVVTAFINESRPHHLGADGLGFFGNLIFYAKNYFSNVGILGTALFFTGLFFIVKKEKMVILAPTFFGFFYWIILSYVRLHWERWALPMYIGPLILTAYALDKIDYLFLTHQKLITRIFCGFLFIIFILNLLLTDLSITTSFTLRDTRNIAKEYADLHGITKNNSIFEGYTPFLPGSPGFLTAQFENLDITKTEYIILSEAMYLRLQHEKMGYKTEKQIDEKILNYPSLKIFNRTTGNSSIYYSPESDFLEPLNLYRQAKIVVNNLIFRDQSLRGPTINIYKINKNLVGQNILESADKNKTN